MKSCRRCAPLRVHICGALMHAAVPACVDVLAADVAILTRLWGDSPQT